jgi:hypothetical protein
MHLYFQTRIGGGRGGGSIQIELQLKHASGENVIKGKHTMATALGTLFMFSMKIKLAKTLSMKIFVCSRNCMLEPMGVNTRTTLTHHVELLLFSAKIKHPLKYLTPQCSSWNHMESIGINIHAVLSQCTQMYSLQSNMHNYTLKNGICIFHIA